MRTCKFIISWILIIFSFSSEGQNIALNKSYTLSSSPNYVHSVPSSAKTSLTDGVYTKGHFWTQSTTVGWQGRQVTITIDLGSIQPIGEITFNTARKTDVSANFPQNIYIFLSVDSINYQYEGDAADTPDNLPGRYLVKKFVLNGIQKSARYVILRIIPQGKLIFCDEIEVLKGKKDVPVIGNINSLDLAVDSLKSLEYNRKRLIQINRKQELLNDGNIDHHFSIASKLQNKTITDNELTIIENILRKGHASDLMRKFNTLFIVEKYNPWDTLNEFHDPKEASGNLYYQFLMPGNGVEYGSFVITNNSTSKERFLFNVVNPFPKTINVELFAIPYVPSADFIKVPDPLITIKPDIVIAPGVSQMFLFRLTGINTGSGKSHIVIQHTGNEINIDIDWRIVNLPYIKSDQLNSNVWAYLNYPMLKDRQSEAARDLEEHHVNSFVIPPTILPKMTTTDYSSFVNYISNFKNVKNYFLFMDYSTANSRNGYRGGEFMSAEWKNKFITWYNGISKSIHDSGFPDALIYLYPYDEIRKNDFNDFKNFVRWAKISIPGIKFYATLSRKESIDSLLGLVDIAQIPLNPDLFKQLPAHHCEVWIYSGGTPSRSLSPYSFYRLMAWKAYANDVKGIGFWNYADEGNPGRSNLITNALLNPSSSYSVVYDGTVKEIISSRRWEAFKLGIEDYNILKQYEKKFGVKRTKLFVNQVLSDPGDTNKADNIRVKMLNSM